MEFRELGRSGVKVSVVGLGAWQWGSREWGWGRSYGRKEIQEAFDQALELGINLVDTAELYGLGESEKLIGELIRSRREEVFIATKVWPLNLSYRRLLKAADRSRRRLGVDVLDLYQVHWPNPLIPLKNTMEALRKLVGDGLVRWVGVSNFKLGKMRAAREALAPVELASNQVKYNMLARTIEKDLIPYAQKEKIAIIAYSPLAQGLLTWKYDAENRPRNLVQKANFRFSPENLTRLTELKALITQLAETHQKTPAQIALNWVIRHENLIAIPGVKSREQVTDDAGAADWRLEESELERLNAALERIKFKRRLNLLETIRRLIPGD